jgi:DNA-binding PadR family transcriptional regulator
VPPASLSSSAYVVLGLLDVFGPGTPYDLKRWVDTSVGYFWSFPRAQLYVEPERLARLGLVEEARETAGRRRRRFQITQRGRQVLREWIRGGEMLQAELRDPGLLKLFFGGAVETPDVVALAQAQAAQHAARLAEYERILPTLEHQDQGAFALATLRLGLLHEQVAVEFWRGIAANPPRASAD